MVSISKCPQCEQLVSLPEGVDLETIVRCPLCAAEYALRESLPPALVPVGSTSPLFAVDSTGDAELPATAAAAAATEEPIPEGQECDLPQVSEPSEAMEAPVVSEGDAPSGVLPTPAVEDPEGFPAPASEAAEPDTSAAKPSEADDLPSEADAAPAETEQPAPVAAGGGMFDFLHHNDEASADAGSETSGESAPAVGSGFPSLDIPDASADAADGPRPSAMAVRPGRRKEKSMAKEMIGAILGGVVGLSITYYALNLLGGQQFDFAGIWLPGVSHTQKHWPGANASDEAGPDASAGEAAVPEVYPPEPRPEGALLRPISRYLDRNYQYLVSDGRVRPSSNDPPVVVTIDGEDFMTAPEGEIIETIDNVQIGGARLKKGYRLQKKQQWWVELGETEPASEPVEVAMVEPKTEVAKIEPKIELEPVELPEVAPEPKESALPDGYIGPKNRSSYSLAQLGETLKAVRAEFKGLQQNEDLNNAFYENLCQLAERLTFLDVEPDTAGLFDSQLAIETMLESLGLRDGRVEQIGRLATTRLDDLDTVDGGIVLAGTSGREVVRDGLHGTMLALPGTETVYNVLSHKPLGVEEGDTVLIAGVAVTNPSENLIGYPGTRPVVIWAALAIGLPKPLDVHEEPPSVSPAEEMPPEELPAEDKPADVAPAEEEPTEEKPADEMPAEPAPTEEEPAAEAPTEDVPADEMPADPAPAEEEPAEEAPAEEAPADTPADPVPAEEEPTEEAPAEEVPADEMPADPVPAEEEPAAEDSAEDTPAV